MTCEKLMNNRLVACAGGALLPVCAAVLRVKFLGMLGPGLPFILFYPVIMLAALAGGFASGMVATVVSALLACYLWLSPAGSFLIASNGNRLGLVVFTVCGTMICLITELMHRARARANAAELNSRLAAERARAREAIERERRQAEEALRSNQELLNSLVSETPDAIYVKDTAGKYLLFNRAAQQLTGKSAGEVLGHSDAELFPGLEAFEMTKGDRVVLASRTPEVFEETIRDAEGRKRTMYATKGPLYDSQGNLTGLFGVLRDVTEQKQVEEEFRSLNDELDRRVEERTAQLEAAMREQESFSYSVSHDLLSPLRHINSYATILIEELGPGITPSGKEHLERICKASNKMGKLIDDLLKLARSSRLALKEEEIDLSRLAKISSLMLQQTDKARQVEISIAEGMVIHGDKTLVRLLIDNLLDNAWKYTAQERVARIEVGSEVVDGQQIFFVSDNGTGFDMAYHDRMFDAFQRLHGAEYEGNGIGLATVKRAVERHGGTVWAEGEVGNGATFYFTLGQEEVCFHQQARRGNG